MSKAFVSSQDEDRDNELGDELEAEEVEDEAERKIPGGGKNYITFKGLEKLKNELHELLTVERPKLVETVAWAASNGDRSENADYIYGKRRLREIDRRIRFLQRRIDLAEAVDPALQKGDRILFGATVTVRDENEAQQVYRIVGVDETDAKSGKISWISPIGQALLQAKVGDSVIVRMPKGEEELEVIRIIYQPIDG